MKNHPTFELEKLVRNSNVSNYSESQLKTQEIDLRQFKAWNLLAALKQDIDFSPQQLTVAFGGAR